MPGALRECLTSLTSHAIASGVITNSQGQADRNGEVYVFALPDQSKLINAPAGKKIPLTLAGYARTNAKGQYAVNVQPASLMKTNGQHGYVNLQVIAVSGGKVAEADYSVMAAGAAWRVEGGTASVPSLSFDFFTRRATLPPVAAVVGASAAVSWTPITPTAPTALLERLRKDTNFASTGMAPQIGGPPGCHLIPGNKYRNKPEHFTTTATISTGGKIPETVTEGTDNSSTHTLGVALEGLIKGKAKWTADGTGSITDSSTNSASITYSYPRTIYNRVNYRDYEVDCTRKTERRPDGFFDLLTSDGGKAQMHWYFTCGHHPAGTSWSTGHATSATIGGGVSLGPINVSAQSGYGTSVELTFNYHVAGEICGNNPDGPLSSSLVEADQASG